MGEPGTGRIGAPLPAGPNNGNSPLSDGRRPDLSSRRQNADRGANLQEDNNEYSTWPYTRNR